MKIIANIVLLLTLVTPFLASAETVLRTGDAITVDSEQVVDGDYYVSVGPIGDTSMSGQVMGDMYALGGSVTVNGTIDEDLSIISGVSNLHASVTDDVRIFSGEVVIADDVGGDVFVIGGTLKVLSSANIKGDLFFFGNDAVVEGSVGGSIFGTSNRLRVDGSVGKDVDYKAYTQLTLDSHSSVAGDVRYTSNQAVVRSPESVIEGDLQQRSGDTVNSREEARKVLIPVFITLFATLSVYLLFRREIATVITENSEHYARATLVGLGIIVLAPIVTVLLIVTVLGSLVGVLVGGLTILLLIGGYTLSSIVCGAYLAKLFTKTESVSLVWLLVGTIVLQSVAIVPVVGPVILIGVYSMSVGMLTISLYRKLQ